jgi:hypothetical protein
MDKYGEFPRQKSLRDPCHGDKAGRSVASGHRIDGDPRDKTEPQMTKLLALIAACAVFAPMAFATLNQAAQIVA